MTRTRVLLAGESWVSAAVHHKGWDHFGSVTFHLGAEPLVAALADEDSAASLGRMPAEHHESHPSQGHHPSSESAQCLGSADIPLTSANRSGDENRRRHVPCARAKDVALVAYVGASGRTTQTDRGTQVHDDNTTLSAVDLLELNRDLQGSRGSACSPRPTSASTRR